MAINILSTTILGGLARFVLLCIAIGVVVGGVIYALFKKFRQKLPQGTGYEPLYGGQ